MNNYLQSPLGNISTVEKSNLLSTANIPVRERRDWLQTMICQEFTRVEITPPATDDLFNEVTFYTWNKLRLSIIKSHAITIDKLPREPHLANQDNYLAVILLSGKYLLEQNGRETFLQPGDMAIYDATQPHRIYCPHHFSKLIVSIPRTVMRDRIAGIEHCTALSISGKESVGSVASHFIRTVASQVETMNASEFSALSEHSLDLLTLALTSIRPQDYNLSRSRSISLRLVKNFVALHLSDASMNTAMIASGVHLSPRYINELFSDEGISLIRYVWKSRLERCHKDILNPALIGCRVSEIAYRWGFNDFSHFSRAFKLQFGMSPRDCKNNAVLMLK